MKIAEKTINEKLDLILTKLEVLENLKNQQQEQEVFLNLDEACNFLKLSKQYMYALVRNKKIPFLKKNNRLWFIQSDLKSYLKN